MTGGGAIPNAELNRLADEAEQKTLKQLLQKKAFFRIQQGFHQPKWLIDVDDAKEAIKMWLTKKREKIERYQLSDRNRIIDFLLEELKK